MNTKLKWLLGVFFAAIILAGARHYAPHIHPQELLQSALAWIKSSGPAGPLIFILLYILSTVFLLPGSALTLGAGAVFGVVRGSVIVSIAATLGATAAFLAGRYIARGWVEKKIQGSEKFKAIDESVAREGWKIVGLTRLSPAFPFTLLNYAYGITKVSLKDYFLASWIGMMPGTVMYVYIGSLAGDIASLGAGHADEPPGTAQWTIRIIGLAATIAVTLYVTKIAKNTLSKRVS